MQGKNEEKMEGEEGKREKEEKGRKKKREKREKEGKRGKKEGKRRGKREKRKKRGNESKLLTTLIDFGDLVSKFLNIYVEKGQVLTEFICRNPFNFEL